MNVFLISYPARLILCLLLVLLVFVTPMSGTNYYCFLFFNLSNFYCSLSLSFVLLVTPRFNLQHSDHFNPRFYLGEDEGFPVSFYVLVIGVFAFHRVGIYAM